MAIPRLRCLECGRTHAVLPAFLLGPVRYATDTLTPYLELAQSQGMAPLAVWQQGLSDGPEDPSTLYRWLRRLATQVARLLPFLQQTLLELAPDSELEPLGTVLLQASTGPFPQLSSVALCQLSTWLSEQLLTVSSDLLERIPPISPVAFLNYLSWQRTGQTLLAAAPKRPP